LEKHTHNTAASDEAELAQQAALDALTPFQTLKPAPRAFPLHCFPKVMRDAVQAASDAHQTPVILVANVALACAAFAVQMHADVMMPFGKKTGTNLYVFTSGLSGQRKSWIESLFMSAAYKFVEDKRKLYAEEHRTLRVQAHGHKQWLKLSPEDRGEKVFAEPVKPLRPQMIFSDVTFQGMLRYAKGRFPSWMYATDEAGQLVDGYAMSADNASTSSSILNKMYSSDRINLIRVSMDEDGQTIEGYRFTLHALIQPLLFATFIQNERLSNQGLHGRIFCAEPPNNIGEREDRDATPEEIKAIDALQKRFAELFAIPANLVADADGVECILEPRVLKFTCNGKDDMGDDAKAAWRAFIKKMEKKNGPGRKYDPVSPFVCKIGEHVARVAGILAMIENPYGARFIHEEQMRRACEIVEWYSDEMLRLVKAVAPEIANEDAQALLEWMRDPAVIAKHGANPSKRTITQYCPRSIRSPERFGPAFDTLLRMGWLTPQGGGFAVTKSPT
jgi:hypothetical protein